MPSSRRKRNVSAKKTGRKGADEKLEAVLPTSPTNATTTSTTTSATTTTTTTTTSDWENLSQWTEESVAQVAGWWNIDEQGVAKLWQLHDRLQDVGHWKNQPNEVVRYLRDAHGNVKLAEAKFRRMVQWRIDDNVDDIIYNYQPPHPLMAEYLPTTVLEATDRGGDPIWLERVGAADSWGLLKTFGQAELIRYAVYIREVCIRGDWAKDYQKRHGKPPSRATAIIDLGGMGWEHCKPSLLPLLKEGLQIIQDYYVGFGKKVIVIRTSKLFPIVWKVAQHFCGENLRNMMVFASADNYLEVLEEYVDLESLPPCIYPQGKGRGGVAMPSRLEGGKVPTLEELDRLWAKRQEERGVPEMVKTLSESGSSLTDEEGLEPTSPRSANSTGSSSPTSSRLSIRSNTTMDPKNALQPEKWTKEKFQEIMQAFCASDQEEVQVRQLQQQLKDVDHWKNSPQSILYFLRDSHHDLQRTEKRFRQTIQWRRDNNVDRILQDYTPPKLMLDYYSTTVLRPDCCDYDGDPIVVERPGASDSWALYQRFGKQGIINYIVWMRENAGRGPFGDAYEEVHGHRVRQVTVVIDLQGLSTRHLKPGLLPLFRSIMEMTQTHYCGTAKRIFLVRAPRIFSLFWSLVQHFLNDQMKNLLVICSAHDYEKVLGEYMNLNHLPPCIYEYGRGEGGPGMPKKLDMGRLPPPTKHDQDLATREDIDPGYTATRTKHRGMKPSGANVGIKATRLCSGVFDFGFSQDECDAAKTVVTLAGR